MTKRWLVDARMADSTRAMRKRIIDRDILPVFQNRKLKEVTPDDLRALCNKVKTRGARHGHPYPRHREAGLCLRHPAWRTARQPGRRREGALDATFVPKDRALSPAEIRLAFHQLETIASYSTIRLALRLILLTMVRKSELVEATWNEVDFENATWTISKTR